LEEVLGAIRGPFSLVDLGIAGIDAIVSNVAVRLWIRLRRAVCSPPSIRDLVELAVAIILFGAMATLIGRDLLRPVSLPFAALASMATLAFVVPALGEEVVFRGLLIPGRDENRELGALWLSTAFFTAWHIVEAFTFLPGAASLFLRVDFLVLAACLGLACGVLRLRSGGLWTAVALHWLAVVIWKGFLGGPALQVLTGGPLA